jgi:hypothetical protein
MSDPSNSSIEVNNILNANPQLKNILNTLLKN